MCGIFALLLKRPLDARDIALGRAGTEALAHRGPDACGEWYQAEAGIYLGHRRLSIIDLGPGGAQPMVRDRHVIAFNGEIYNFSVLKQALELRGRKFTSHSDTEVLLMGLAEWGETAMDRIDGMFAFVHWDGGEALIAVDVFGEKSLYWAETVDGIYISSEIAPLAQLLQLVPSMPAEIWPPYLALGFIPSPATIYPNVRRMTPASLMRVRAGQVVATRSYWSPPRPQPGKGRVRPIDDAGLSRLGEALTSSLERRLVADVPVALFLSGGIDSGLVAALAKRELDRNLDCVTVAFRDGKVTDESAAAGAVARHLQLPHHIIVNEEKTSGIERIVQLLGQPSGMASMLPVDQISRATSHSVKVALTGLGGDEVTFGYDKATHYWRWRHLYALPDRVRARAGGLLQRAGGRLARAGMRIAPPRHMLYVANKNFPVGHWLRSLPGFDAWSLSQFSSGLPLEFDVPWYDATEVMPNMQLTASDHASMRHGLELRTPYLARDVFATVAEFDARALLAFGQKSLLRRLLGRYLPHSLFDRPKSGFVYPLEGLVNYSAAEPPLGLPNLSDAVVRAAWSNCGDGWNAIRLRLLAAKAFFTCVELRLPEPKSAESHFGARQVSCAALSDVTAYARP
jgi:asparagine synthase (glutamine-hydrolysing)